MRTRLPACLFSIYDEKMAKVFLRWDLPKNIEDVLNVTLTEKYQRYFKKMLTEKGRRCFKGNIDSQK